MQHRVAIDPWGATHTARCAAATTRPSCTVLPLLPLLTVPLLRCSTCGTVQYAALPELQCMRLGLPPWCGATQLDVVGHVGGQLLNNYGAAFEFRAGKRV
jgi:hypothetical protein